MTQQQPASDAAPDSDQVAPCTNGHSGARGEARPGRVVFFPSLPRDTQVPGVLAFAASHGEVLGHFFHGDSRHLFVEMARESQVRKLVEVCATGDAVANGLPVRATVSTRQTVHQPAQTPVLLVSIDAAGRPITCDALREVFERAVPERDGQATLRIQLLSTYDHAGQLRGFAEFCSAEAATVVLRELRSARLPTGGLLTMAASQKDTIRISEPQFARDYATGEGDGGCPPSRGQTCSEAAPCVVLVSGLVDGTTPEMLARLFGTVGDVTAVKILFRKKTEALVQFRLAEHAAAGIRYLSGCPFYESEHSLRVVPARSRTISGQDDSLTAYWQAPCSLHRFGGKGSQRALGHRRAPAAVLHISNVPAQMTTGMLEHLIAQIAPVERLRWLPSGDGAAARQALASFSCTRLAVAVLIGLHTYECDHFPLPRERGLIVSFSSQQAYASGEVAAIVQDAADSGDTDTGASGPPPADPDEEDSGEPLAQEEAVQCGA
eukprot:TRINITY_DN14384_c0_g1_i1.p1 TRINITY_DN14384_c0_g1~~TRINITY_DN14384_c0_g1_i1.p1  ORF type:complete len:518 (+),score=141.01 TRINITY_DN14384_c0_g1_i1:78-1556(+)